MILMTNIEQIMTPKRFKLFLVEFGKRNNFK